MSENPPKPRKVDPEKQAEADARSKRNKEAALKTQGDMLASRAEKAQRERVREGMRNRTIREYRQEKEQEDREVRKLHKDTEERQIDEFLDGKNRDAALRRQVKERLLKRNKAEEALRPIIDAKKATAAALRKSAGITRSREARPKDLLAQAEVVEAEIAVLEQQLRDMVLRPGKRSRELATASAPESAEAPEVEEASEAAAEDSAVAPIEAEKDRSEASPLEIIDARLRDLWARFSSNETPPAERDSIRSEIKEAMIERDQLLSLMSIANESGTIEYDQVPEFTGNQDALDAIDQLQDSVEEEPLELTEKVTPEATLAPAPRDPMGPDEDGKDIVMLNSVLTRQAMGAEKRTKKNAEKMKKFGTFPADPRYGGTVGAASAETSEAVATPTRAERLAAKQKKDTKNKRRWLLGGAGVLGAAGLLALFNPFGKKVETTAVKQPERPAAARTAEQAGLKTPLVSGVWDTPPAVTVPAKPEAVQAPAANQETAPTAKVSAAESRVRARVDKALERAVAAGNISDADAQMVMAWEHMAYEKARQALPPGSDTRITSVVEIIRANRENPYAFAPEAAAEQPIEDARPEAAPAAPEAAAEKPATVQNFMYGAKGKETLLLVSSESEEAFVRAREYAKTLPVNEVVRFEAVRIDPVTGVAEPLRGAFMSLGDGRTSPFTRDPETGQPFTAPDPSLMSRARRGGEAAAGR